MDCMYKRVGGWEGDGVGGGGGWEAGGGLNPPTGPFNWSSYVSKKC